MRTSGTRLAVTAFAAVALFTGAEAQELRYAPGKTLGVNVIPAERNRWKAQCIEPARYDRTAKVEAREADFFLREYGEALKPFEVRTDAKGAWSRLWGERHDDLGGQAVRFGRGWLDYLYSQAEVRAEIVQTGGDPIAWTLFQHGRGGKTKLLGFTTGSGTNRIEKFLKLIRAGALYSDGGLELVAKGKAGAVADVRDLRLVPVRIPVSYRRRFTLAEKPWRAGISFPARTWYALAVNGREVPHDGHDTGIAHLDLTGFLKAGENEIVLSLDGNAGWDRSPRTAIEVFAVAADGRTDFFPSDGTWEARTADGAWGKVRPGGVYGIERMPNGTPYATGRLPLHAGPLDPRPQGTEWPVFCEGKPIRWDVALPPGMKGAEVTVEAADAFTGEPAQRRTGETPVPLNSPLTIALDGLKGGAYRLKWTLLRDGKPVDALENEMIVAGRIAQDEFAAEDIEAELARRKTLVGEIDPTAEAPEGEFLDHSGYYGKHVTGVGRVVERDGFRVRETGPGWLDLISYRIPCGELGEPHIVEVDYPDTREQYLYASVSETMPVAFCNNSPPPGARSWPNASGAAFSGGLFRPTGRMATLRFVFFPASRNLTFNLENGMYGKPAGISAIRIYQVKGGLPAMRIPKTDRVYMNHNERPLFFNWGNAVVPFMQEYDLAYREGMWAGAYKAIANRIRQLRFFGHNAALEGVFMYHFLFKTRSGESESTCADFDTLVPIVRMYAANGIRTFLSYEYTGTPNLLKSDLRGTSDRDVAAGRPTLSFVDRYGRQTLGNMSGGWMNFLEPRVRASMGGLMKEIYDRYETMGVEGIVLQTEGCGWQPCFYGVTSKQDPDEVGYDDFTFGLFEKETGFRMNGGGGTGGKRFADRYAAVHASPEALAKWRNWRRDKVAEVHCELAAVVHARSKWRYIVSPCLTQEPAWELGYDRARYPKDGPVELLLKRAFQKEWRMEMYGDFISPEARDLYRELDAAYLTCHGLNEHNFSRVDGAKAWWWRSYGVIVYDMKPSGENAFFDLSMLCRDHTPKTLIHTWLDVNIPTAHDAEERRFLAGFYATPTGGAKPYPEARGVTAHLYGGKLQLLNATPYAIRERRAWWRFGKGLEIRPFGVVVLDEPRPVEFEIAPGSADEVARVEAVVADSRVRERLGAKNCALWDAAATAYDRMVLSREADFLDAVLRFEAAKAAFVNQEKFEAALERDGVARVNCGFGQPWTDELGVAWLPDQKDTGFRAYGCADGVWTSRGEIPILKTGRPSVYRTESSESGKPMVYRFPVKDGTYRVTLHIADTYNQQDRGVKWIFGVGDDIRRVNIWEKAGGTGKTATVHVFENVKPKDGRLTVTFALAVVNGIEIRRVD